MCVLCLVVLCCICLMLETDRISSGTYIMHSHIHTHPTDQSKPNPLTSSMMSIFDPLKPAKAACE